MPAFDLRRFGPTALITGASDGIGRAAAHAAAARGLSLILVARRAEALEALAAELRLTHGVPARALPLDLAATGGPARLLEALAGEEIGLAVLAAGYGSSGPFLGQDASEEARMVDLNCRAVVTLVHGLGRPMAERGRGGLVLFGSLVGFQGAPWSSTYAATKAFVQALAEGLAVELAPSGVSVLAVAPGPVASGFGARAHMALGQAARPEVVAESLFAALGRGGTVRPGLLSKGLGWSLGILPRAARVRVMGRIMKGMAEGGR